MASWVINESDTLIVLGASFSNHTGITTKRPTVQVDTDPMGLGKFHGVDVPVQGAISESLEGIAAALSSAWNAEDQKAEIATRWRLWREEKARRATDRSAHGINSAYLLSALADELSADAILAVDVGNNTYSFGRYFEMQQQAVLMSGYLGSIGFSFPAALGAWAATQEVGSEHGGRQVVSVSGDGGFGQYLAEFTTAVKFEMKITRVLLNNGELGKISKEQRAGHWDVWQTSLVNPKFAEYSTLCGGPGIRVTEYEQLGMAMRRALDHPGPALVEVMTDVELI